MTLHSDATEQRLAILEATNARLVAEVESLRRSPATAGRREPIHPTRQVSAARTGRRSILRKAAVIATGAVALDALRSNHPARAADNVMHYGATQVASAPTAIVTEQPHSSGVYGFAVTEGLNALPYSGAVAGHARSTYAAGVLGYSDVDRAGVVGMSEDGLGVFGWIINASNPNAAVSGQTEGAGLGVRAQSRSGIALEATITNAANNAAAIHAVTSGSGAALKAEGTSGYGVAAISTSGTPIRADIIASGNPNPAIKGRTFGNGPAVAGEAGGTGPGLQGNSASGRGGVFSGGRAQIRLTPSTATAPPTTGCVRGDLFVDKTGRLWYCKTGGSKPTWKQLA